jgi:hypothetical protein
MATCVPNSNLFSLQDVVNVVGGNSLSQAFANASDGHFNATYKGSKDRLSNFRDYHGSAVNLVQISSTGQGGGTVCANMCVSTSPAMVAGECYFLSIGGSLSTTQQGASSYAYMQVLCNSVCKYCCCAPANSCMPSLSSNFQVNYGDHINVIIYAQTTCTCCSSTANAFTCICASNIKGGFSNGTTCVSCSMYTG